MKWFEEQLHHGLALRVTIDTLLYHEKTKHQELVLFENRDMGRVLGLDHVVQTTSRDEYIYHEMIIHPAVCARLCWYHEQGYENETLDVLIIGGGDGGAAREVLKYKNAHVVMVDIDKRVIDLCVRYLPDHSAGAFQDERLDLIIADGASYVQQCQRRFDVIVIDSTDPIGPGRKLFEEPFVRACHALLKHGGLFINQNGVPFFQPHIVQTSHKHFKAVFKHHRFYFASVPTYIGGVMAFGWGCDEPIMQHWQQESLLRVYRQQALTTRYYTPQLGTAAFVMPPDIAMLLSGDAA